MIRLLFLVCSLFRYVHTFDTQIQQYVPEQQAVVSFTMPLENDALYKEYISFCTDIPQATITQWSTDVDPVTLYDAQFKEDKKAYTQNITFTLHISLQEAITELTIRFTYYLKNKGAIQEQLLHVSLPQEERSATAAVLIAPQETENALPEDITPATITKVADLDADAPISWSCKISQVITHTNSIWLQCLLIMLLGMLLSFTPCIYPMIPITVGILQGQGSTSVVRNLALSLAYTVGVATTFALLGLTAAYTGKLFGTFMQHPVVIISIVILLLYLAGSMFGFYDMYTPRMFALQKNASKGGSLLAAFMFGAISGTVASPCVSPGLALVLSIVAGLANPLLGFLFLFMFGIGLSLPLLIIGTFSSSINVLPRAGFWMVEVKKMFGFLLLGVSIYFLNTILPAYVAPWLSLATPLIAGLYYLWPRKHKSMTGRMLYNGIGISLIVATIVMSYFALRSTLQAQACATDGFWLYDYACAQEKAAQEHKPMLVKVGAPCCSMCTAIDKKFFYNNEVISLLKGQYVPVIIDGGQNTPEVESFVKTFNIIGFPTILVINPQDQTVIKRWSSDLYHYTIEQLLDELRSYKK